MNEWAVGVYTSTAARCKYFGETLIFQLVELPYLTFAPRQPSYRVIQPARRPPPKGPTNWMIILGFRLWYWDRDWDWDGAWDCDSESDFTDSGIDWTGS